MAVTKRPTAVAKTATFDAKQKLWLDPAKPPKAGVQRAWTAKGAPVFEAAYKAGKLDGAVQWWGVVDDPATAKVRDQLGLPIGPPLTSRIEATFAGGALVTSKHYGKSDTEQLLLSAGWKAGALHGELAWDIKYQIDFTCPIVALGEVVLRFKDLALPRPRPRRVVAEFVAGKRTTTQYLDSAGAPVGDAPPKPPAAKPKPVAKAKKSKQTLLERVASWPIPTDAAGLARPWKGMAVDERAHALLGLGYPRMLVPVDEPVAELPDFATYKKLYEDAIVIPRALAPIRQAIEETEVFSLEEYEKSMRSGTPAPLAEAVEGLFKYGRQTLRTLEVLHGSAAVAEAAVKQLAAFPANAWHSYDELDEDEAREIGQRGLESRGYMTIRQLGHLLWRVPVAVEKRLRAQLVKLLDKARDPDGELWRPAQALDVILNGRAAVERNGSNFNGVLHLADLVHAHDDPEWVAATVIAKLGTLTPADREHFDIQLAVVGGPKVLAKLRASTGAFKKDQATSIADQLSLCR